MTRGMVCVHHPAVVAHQCEQGDRIAGANDRYGETRMSPWGLLPIEGRFISDARRSCRRASASDVEMMEQQCAAHDKLFFSLLISKLTFHPITASRRSAASASASDSSSRASFLGAANGRVISRSVTTLGEQLEAYRPQLRRRFSRRFNHVVASSVPLVRRRIRVRGDRDIRRFQRWTECQQQPLFEDAARASPTRC